MSTSTWFSASGCRAVMAAVQQALMDQPELAQHLGPEAGASATTMYG